MFEKEMNYLRRRGSFGVREIGTWEKSLGEKKEGVEMFCDVFGHEILLGRGEVCLFLVKI
jgi:hypothetical protein